MRCSSRFARFVFRFLDPYASAAPEWALYAARDYALLLRHFTGADGFYRAWSLAARKG